MSSIVRGRPISLGRIIEDAAPPMNPALILETANRALDSATIMSQRSARSNAAPFANPWTAAIIGFLSLGIYS